MDDDPVRYHKLCGYLCAILTVSGIVPSGSPCRLFSGAEGFGFESENGVLLSPLDGNAGDSPESLNKGGKRKGRRKIGTIDGSVSVVRLIHALVARKCVKIQARVICVETGDNGEARAAVLVDVYLPIELWSGWQFPKSGSLAGALFRHLSCDWKERRLMLANFGEIVDAWKSMQAMWIVSNCHVPGCKLHCNGIDHSRKRLFELHEIFKAIPSITNGGVSISSSIKPADPTCASGIWDVPDDVLIHIMMALGPLDLTSLAATCHHLRSLAALVMPCMKLKLFPHQQAAVEWMLKRERKPEVLPHPLYTQFFSEDGFLFYVNTVSGQLITGTGPTVRDFQGGMFCDEPGLGKTITALSLILKTQGTMAEPPLGAQVIWCTPNGSQKCGYYELNDDGFTCDSLMLGKRASQDARNGFSPMHCSLPKRLRLIDSCEKISEGKDSFHGKGAKSHSTPMSEPARCAVQCTRNFSHIKKNLLYAYDGEYVRGTTAGNLSRCVTSEKQAGRSYIISDSRKESGKPTTGHSMSNDLWVQCDSCGKWRKLADRVVADVKAAWFCSMNDDHGHQRCSDPEEAWDSRQPIRYLPGFCDKQSPGGMEENVSFFISVLREHCQRINSKTKKALVWLVGLSQERLLEMETIGVVGPVFGTSLGEVSLSFHKIFLAFGLIKRVQKGITRWYYPQKLENLAFDSPALRIALGKPLQYVRLYLSRATLIVVPSNLVDHWTTQIHKHVRTSQLRLYVWTDHKKPPAHSLAWDYDIVITTFSRLSAEWDPQKGSPLMQVHWFRVILDEGHTLGSSLGLTNKLQMTISLTASNRWLLTGTPTPNTPNSQLSHLQPLLKFLHEEAFGQNQKSWENGILRPFEEEMEEGRSRLLQLLQRCMISARKTDLKTIPPCIKTVTFLDFNDGHAKSYNQLVVTVRRNILMADWNDPSHVESLLNPKQWKFRSATIRNVRLSCCVAGHIKLMDAGHDIQETMDALVENGLDPMSEEYAMIKYNLLYGGNCLRCNEWCRLPIITPCRHLLCLNCVALDSEKCALPACGNLYEMETPETLARPENPNPKWPVPKDLIELQPSYKQDDWNPDWQSTSSTKVAYLVEKLKGLQESYTTEGNVDKLPCPSQSGTGEATFMNMSNMVRKESGSILPEKVLIFSQFLEHIHVIEQQLTIAGIKFAGMYSPMHAANKMKSLGRFQHDDSCMALLMDGTAALGLDLSFVTYVFLMEPIWNRSMEEQVISRAHRMGATRPIHVETLAMNGTIEEQMLEFLEDSVQCRRFTKETSQETNQEGTKTCRTLHDFAESNYLARLSFIQTNSKL